MDLLNIYENIRESTAMDRSGFKTLHSIPRYDLAYFLFISLPTSSFSTKKYSLVCLFIL